MTLALGSIMPETSGLASGRVPAVRVENNTLINSRAGYYFNLPADWSLKSDSDYQSVEVAHPSSRARFSVGYERARGDANAYSMALLMALKSPSSGWVNQSMRGVTVGGHAGSEMSGTRTTRERGITSERFCVVVDGEYVYTISSSVPREQADGRGVDIEQILSSFNWGKPLKAK